MLASRFNATLTTKAACPTSCLSRGLTSISLVGMVQCMLLNIITDKTDETFVLLNFSLLPCATIHRSNC